MPYLPMALDSIINQTYKNLEILCINDGSTDKTQSVLEHYAKKDSRIRVVKNEVNLKLIATLNKGIELATGEYIARMDADDISDRNRIRSLYAFLTKRNCDIVSCNNTFIDKQGKLISYNYLKCKTATEVSFGSYFFTPIGHALLLGKKEIFERFSYSEGKNVIHTEDYELWTRMIRNNVTICNQDQVLYSVRTNEDSVSKRFEKIQKNNFTICAQTHQEQLLDRKIDFEDVKIVVNRFNQISINQYLKGRKLMSEIEIAFNSKQKLTSEEMKSNKLILKMQQLDILIQARKKAHSFTDRIGLILILIKLILTNYYYKQFRGYFLSKFK